MTMTLMMILHHHENITLSHACKVLMCVFCLSDNGPHPLNTTTWQKEGCQEPVVCECMTEREQEKPFINVSLLSAEP